MNLERIVQIHIATLAIIGAILLGIGQNNLLLPLLAVFAAVTSVVFTDTLNWFHLNRLLANMAALLALFFSLGDFLHVSGRDQVVQQQQQLMAIANLLIYLQITLFYQRKNPRLYWQLAVLSLLQVVVSAALNVGIEFGLLLILYAVVAFSTLSFFFVYREVTRCVPGTTGGPARSRRRRDVRTGEAGAQFSLLDPKPVIRPTTTAEELGQKVVGWQLLWQTSGIGLTTLVFAFVLFFCVPRSDNAAGRRMSTQATHVVGFAPEVTLNELGRILESHEPVMRVSFRDLQTSKPYQLFGDPYFHGSVLGDYHVKDHVARWSQLWPSGADENIVQRYLNQNPILPRPPQSKHLVRQETTLVPISEPVLFGIAPSYTIKQTLDKTYFNPITQQMGHPSHEGAGRQREYRYSVGTTGLLGGLQLNVTPHYNRLDSEESRFARDWELQRLLEYDAERLPELKRIADEIGDRARAGGASRVTIARQLRDHFLEPDRYVYTLDIPQVSPDETSEALDPIENFVANHRTGHCEYFASALVMMLRSQGIPARMVIGFRGGEYNPLGDYYLVLQSHAHAWVEAYLDADEAAGEVPPGVDLGPAGGWLRLDPTPGSDIDRARQLEPGMMDVVDNVLDYARTLWSDYILDLTAKRQRESIFDPVSEKANLEDWPALLNRLTRDRDATVRRMKELLLTGRNLAAALGLAALLAVWHFARRRSKPARASIPSEIVRRWRSRRARGTGIAGDARQKRHVEFYRRLEQLLAQFGIHRNSGQTQRELANRATERMTGASLPAAVQQAPERIVDAFYRVRFGNVNLSEAETQSIDEALRALEQAVTNRTSTRETRRKASGR